MYKEYKIKYWTNTLKPVLMEYSLKARNLSEAYLYIYNKKGIPISVTPTKKINS